MNLDKLNIVTAPAITNPPKRDIISLLAYLTKPAPTNNSMNEIKSKAATMLKMAFVFFIYLINLT